MASCFLLLSHLFQPFPPITLQSHLQISTLALKPFTFKAMSSPSSCLAPVSLNLVCKSVYFQSSKFGIFLALNIQHLSFVITAYVHNLQWFSRKSVFKLCQVPTPFSINCFFQFYQKGTSLFHRRERYAF